MYYITSQNNQIIAIDPTLSTLLGVESIDDLYKGFALGNIKFSSSTEDEKVTITTAEDEETYNVTNHHLSSMLGNITLVQIQTSPKVSIPVEDDISTFALEEDLEEDNDESFIIKDEDTLNDVSIEDLLNQDISTEQEISLLDNDLLVEDQSISDDSKEEEHKEENDDMLYDLLMPDTSEETINEAPVTETPEEGTATKESDDAFFDLILPNAPDESIDEVAINKIALAEDTEVTLADDDQSPIVIDIEKISQNIGISIEDYNIFLNEYIDTALSFEKDLQSNDKEKRSRAIGTLAHLSNVLHLPVVTEIVAQIKNASANDQDQYIESFYATLARLTTSPLEAAVAEEELLPILELDTKREEETLPKAETKAEAVTETTESFGSFDLNDVEPIHFDFQLEQAANELNLPVELIEEFVTDFIEQAHTETEKMLEAYEKGDIDTIQKIGHLLKGTSSNLRINPLADTLYEIQFCEDSSKLEDMIKLFWGHFLSLETQINLTTK